MILRKLILLAFISTLLSCNSDSSNQTPSSKIDTTTTRVDTGTETRSSTQEQYTYIVRIFQKGDIIFLDADYIQYLTGEAAIEAAKKAHQADTLKTEDGKTHISVPNDYFIVNENNKIRQLPLAKDCVFDLIINPGRVNPIADNSLKSLQIIFKESPFILTLNDSGVVVKIKELFVP